MRISDWRSDVCSSDLRESAALNSLPLIRTPLSGGRLPPIRPPSSECRSPPRGVEGRRGGEAAFLAGYETDHRGAFVDVAEPPHRNLRAHVIDLALRRSEEHTSELPVTNAHLVFRLLLEKKHYNKFARPLTTPQQ